MNCFWKESEKNLKKKENPFRLVLLIFSLLLNIQIYAQIVDKPIANSNSLLNLNRGMQAFGFRTQNQWNEINARYLQPYYPSVFTPGDTSFISYLFYPYWQGRLYQQYNFKNIKRLGYFGYIINPDSGAPNLTYSWTVRNVVDYSKPLGTKSDLILFCQGANETNRFLGSSETRENCIKQVLELTNERPEFSKSDTTQQQLYKADGINVYLPDFDFNEKRNFGLFIKDLYLTYSYQKDSVKLIVTLPLRDTVHYKYLKSLDMYIDELYFADYDYRGMMFNRVLTMKYHDNYLRHKNELTIFREIWAEIMLAEFKNPFGDNTLQDIFSNWTTYFLGICFLWGTIFITLLLYLLWGKINQFINENLSFFILIAALLVCETLILGIFMVEKMNYTTLLINIDNPGSYYFLLVPLILVVIFPLSRLIQSRRQLP